MFILGSSSLLKRGKNLFSIKDEIIITHKNEIVGALINLELWQSLTKYGYIELARDQLRQKLTSNDSYNNYEDNDNGEIKIDNGNYFA